jgi:histidine ammonia-lyase
MNQHIISDKYLNIFQIKEIIENDYRIELSEETKKRVIENRSYLDQKLAKSSQPIYGINTGFGSLYNISIDENDLSTLQSNLIKSHACGMGDRVPKEIVQLILLLKIQSLSYGYSAISIEVLERLVSFYNNGIFPIIYQQGSLGASGDLAPLAHLCLPLLGLGEVEYKNEIISGQKLLRIFDWKPINLQSKEGLALLNGTQFMLGYATYIAIKSLKIEYFADLIGATSLEGYDGRLEPFDASIHNVRPHEGQIKTAENFRNFLKDSQIAIQPKKHVQDPYSFRCIPQVHGASKDTLAYFIKVVETEINSVTDNPNVFDKEDKIISGGNFHGQPLALVLDFIAIALAEWANISERRTYLLLSGQREMPLYLVAKPGLNSGFMIAQYTAASIVSQNKQYATPASIDSIVSSNGQEDHVSMGANSATKCFRILENVASVLAIEAMTAAQALEFRRPLKSSAEIESFYAKIRKEIPFVEQDIVMSEWLQKTKKIIFW